MANNCQGAYAPLPQSLSDSDSEKDTAELHRMHFPEDKLQNGHDSHHYRVPSHVINITIHQKSGLRSMTPMRKFYFFLSIGLVLKVLFGFMYLLPCSGSRTCPAKITNWKDSQDGVELKGRINVVRGPYKNSIVLAMLVKKSFNMKESQNGVIALKSTTGSPAWFLPRIGTPDELNCDLIDVNSDGTKDCLLLGETGLEIIDPIKAESIWHAHNDKMLISNMDFPKLLPDMNGDEINDFITITDFNSNRNKLIIICGRTGRLLLDMIVKLCEEIDDFKYEDEENLFIYQCKNHSSANYYKLTKFDLQKRVANSSYFISPVKIEYHPKQGQEYILKGRKLLIENTGMCPGCHASILLFDDSNQKKLNSWNYDYTYVMNPTTFSFRDNSRNMYLLKGHINGFILKLWQWPNDNSKHENDMKKKISEKVILITFNETNIHAINVSFVPITQLCITENDCQPALENRKDSLLISDLDFDGSQELISYSSTYSCNNDMKCMLQSNVEVIRLEAELPKLYAK